MNGKRIVDIEPTEFNQILDEFITRETAEMGEIDAPLFYEAIEAIYQPKATPTTVELQAQIVGTELELSLPASSLPHVNVHGNEIKINDLRFVIHLVPPAKAPAYAA